MPDHFPKGVGKILKVSEIIIDERLQMREDGLSPDHAADIAAAVLAKKKLPKPRVWFVAEMGYFVTDGFHTLGGYRTAGRKDIAVTLLKGTFDDAMLDAAAANQQHLGLKRSAADKRRAVRMALAGSGAKKTDSYLSKYLSVSDKLVKEVRDEMIAATEVEDSPERTGGDGKTYKSKRRAKPDGGTTSLDGPWRTFPVAEWGNIGMYGPACEAAGIASLGDLFDALTTRDIKGIGPFGSASLLPKIKNLADFDGDALATCYAGPAAVPVSDCRDSDGNPIPAKKGFAWAGVEEAFGKAARIPDAIAREYPGEKGQPDYIGATRLLHDLGELLLGKGGWKRRLEKSQKAS